MFNFLIRNGYLLRGKLKKEKFDFNTSIENFRERCEQGAAKYAKIPGGVTIRTQVIEDIKSEWLIPEGAISEKLILYIHLEKGLEWFTVIHY